MLERAEIKNGSRESLNRPRMSIFLIGMRGSGKSTVGERLAAQTGRRFIDLDRLLVERMGKGIPDIVAAHGWSYFRDRESEVVQAVTALEGLVVATGGGAILRPSNIEALRRGVVIYLDTPVPTLCDRIGNDPNRPSLTDESTLEEELTKVYGQRSGLYEHVSDIAFGTENQTPEALTKTIFHYLRRERYV